MKFTLYDREHANTRAEITTETDLLAKLLEYRKMEPFIIELISEAGEKLTIGVGGPVSFVQHTGAGGLPPYRCASIDDASRGGEVEFMISGTPTPIPKKFCIPFEKMSEVVLQFVRHGNLSKSVKWEEV